MSCRCFPAVHELDAGNDETLGEDLHGVDGKTSGILATRISLVGLKSLDRHDFSRIIENRGVDVVIRKMAAARVGIVADEDVARPPVIALAEVEAVTHRHRRDEEQLGNPDREAGQAAMTVHDAGVALVRLIDDGGGRRAAEVRRHLVADGLEGTPHDARRHGVDGSRSRERRLLGREMPVQFVGHGALSRGCRVRSGGDSQCTGPGAGK